MKSLFALALALLPMTALAEPAARDYWPSALVPMAAGAPFAALALPPPEGGWRVTYSPSFGLPVAVSYAPAPDGTLQGRFFAFSQAAQASWLRGKPIPRDCFRTDAPPGANRCKRALPGAQAVTEVKEFTLPADKARALTRAFAALQLCTAPPDPNFGMDGATWLFETTTGAKTCAATRWTPEAFQDAQSRAFAAAGMMALDLGR